MNSAIVVGCSGAYDELANLGHDPGPSGLFPPLAVVPLPRNQPSVPSQKGFRCDDTGDFCQEFPAKRLTLYRESCSPWWRFCTLSLPGHRRNNVLEKERVVPREKLGPSGDA